MHRLLLLVLAMLCVPALTVAQERIRERSPVDERARPILPPNDAPERVWTDAEVQRIRSVMAALQEARQAVARAERELLELVLGHRPVDPPDDPPDREPPDDDPPDDDPPDRDPPDREPPDDDPSRRGAWPDPLPFDAPPIPEYDVPDLADCEWTIAGGVFTSTRGLPAEANPHDAYLASIEAGHVKPITFGVWDDGGRFAIGGMWNPDSGHSITRRVGDTWSLDLQVEIVGLDDECEVGLGWGTQWGYGSYVAAFNVGLRGPEDSFIIRANSGVGTLIIDGCWWLPSKSFGPTILHASGMHIDQWHTLVWRRHQFRGEKPGDPGTLVREHSGYLKSCVGDPENGGGTWIVENNLLGGNRTGFQVRPQAGDNPRPRGPIVIAYNFADGYGWTHGSGGETEDGGGCLTSWVGPESDVYVFGNRITDARYACLTISGQGAARNWLNAGGHPIRNVHVYGNTFTNVGAGRAAKRGAVSLSAAEVVHFYPGNEIASNNAEVSIDDPWNMGVNGILLGELVIYGQETEDYLRELDLLTWDPGSPNKALPYDKSRLSGAPKTETACAVRRDHVPVFQ